MSMLIKEEMFRCCLFLSDKMSYLFCSVWHKVLQHEQNVYFALCRYPKIKTHKNTTSAILKVFLETFVRLLDNQVNQ